MNFPASGNITELKPAELTNIQLQYRLIAVWALAEGFLGGIMHGLHLPFTGLVIGSVSVCCLALLSRVQNRRGELLKATLLVMLVKAMLSPHSPPMAYFAVFSQGLVAEFLFGISRHYKLNCFLLAILTQLQSAIQHIVVITVIFGLDFWVAVDQYLNKITGSLGLSNVSYALYLATGYVGLHLLTGIYVGWLAGKLPAWLRRKTDLAETVGFQEEKVNPGFTEFKVPKKKKKKVRFNLTLVITWVLLAAVFLQSYFGLGPAILPQAKALQILIRSVLIVSVWYFVISPFLLNRLHQWLQKQKGPVQVQLRTVLQTLPETQVIIRASWHQTAALNGFKRLRSFVAKAGPRLFALPD